MVRLVRRELEMSPVDCEEQVAECVSVNLEYVDRLPPVSDAVLDEEVYEVFRLPALLAQLLARLQPPSLPRNVKAY